MRYIIKEVEMHLFQHTSYMLSCAKLDMVFLVAQKKARFPLLENKMEHCVALQLAIVQ